jgi:purine nucleosidase
MKPRKVILDVDPGIDDAVALCMALFDPRLEVVAVTATGGNVDAEQATRNVVTIIEQLDPPRWPRVGVAQVPERELPAHTRHINGSDGLGDSGFAVAELHNRRPSEKVLCDEVHAAPGEVTVVALGPLTNIARAAQRDPDVVNLIDQLVIMGGTWSGSGNVTPAAEFNIYCDPIAARGVFHLPMTKTLVPLDVTSRVEIRFDLLDELPSEATRVGRFLRKILGYSFRSHRQVLGQEGIHLPDAVTLVAVTNPELFETRAVGCDVEVQGALTMGATVMDRRSKPEWRSNLHVATEVDPAAVRDCILRGIKAAAEQAA